MTGVERGAMATTGRPTLDYWRGEYAAIAEEFVDGLQAEGIGFAPPLTAEQRERRAATVDRLAAKGAHLMNGGASVSTGFLSSACRACVGDCGSRTFYINLRCHRGCYFCFNPNQVNYERHVREDADWRGGFDRFVAEAEAVTHVGLTGGEPLLCKDKTLAFLAHVQEGAPAAHVRLYTAGEGFDVAFAREAVARGLDEIRFSVKLDEGERAVAEVLKAMAVARGIVPTVMVEMPVIPGQDEAMRSLLRALDERGVDGINLLEFCYPLHRWDEFARRGFTIKNPPFEVLYEYEYAGALPVAGSDEACLGLLEYALDEGLGLGVHYCSLANKNINQVLQVNRRYPLDDRLCQLEGDGFYHVAKVFDQDVAAVRAHFAGRRIPCQREDDTTLVFHPRHRGEAERAGAVVADSICTVQESEAGPYVRELSLRVGE